MKRSDALSILLLFASAGACAATAQVADTHESAASKTAWTDYKYPDYGFAVRLPRVPKETSNAAATRYTLYRSESSDSDKAAVLRLMVRRSQVDCALWLAEARDKLREPPPFPLSVLPHQSAYEVIVDGNPAIEGDAPRNGMQAGYQREQCLNGRLYSFEAGFPKGQPRPKIIDRILKSFRVLADETAQ